MKNQLMGLAACALILSSCSQNQEIENYEQLNREEVRLAPYVNKSKASVMDPAALQGTGFKVYAVQHDVDATDFLTSDVFMNQLKESWNSDRWTHDGKYYWPEGKALSFFMVAPYYDSSNPYLIDDANANANLDITQGASMTLPVTIKDNVADQIDILAASVLNQTRSGLSAATVDFTFKHILSRIGFKASMDKEDNLKFKITGLKYSYTSDKVVSSGTYNYDVNKDLILNATKHIGTDLIIGLTAENVILDNISTTKKLEATLNNEASYLMILPQSLAVAAIKVEVTYQIAVAGDEYGTPKTAEINLPAQTYEMSKAYTHNLKFKASAGGLLEVTFGTVGVAPWENGTQPENVNVPK